MHIKMRRELGLVLLGGLLILGCTPAAPPSPSPTAARAAAPSQTAAVVGSPAAKPVASPSPAVSASPSPAAAKPAASPAPFDERAVADFYRGKVIRIVAGASPGGGFDLQSRLLANHLSRHMPGNPQVIVENRPGAGTLLAANAVYNSDPKDGTFMGSFNETLVLQQAVGGEGIQFDARKYQWIGSANNDVGVCLARTDSRVQSLQELLDGKEFIIGSPGAGVGEDTPRVANAALGTNFKLVRGYNDSSNVRLALERKEIDGFCSSLSTVLVRDRQSLEGPSASLRLLFLTGDKAPSHALLQGVPTLVSLAKSEEAKSLLRAAAAPGQISKPFAVAPGVLQDRVLALRRAVASAYADPQLRAEAERAGLEIDPSTGDEVTRVVEELLSTPPATLQKLKAVLTQT